MTEHEPLLPVLASRQAELEEVVSLGEAGIDVETATYLTARGITAEAAAMSRLGKGDDLPPGYERHRGRLLIPYLDKHGKPLTIRSRCLREHDHRASNCPKYYGTPDEPSRVYGIPSLHRATDTLHITEGEMDAIVLSQNGYPAIAIPGAAAWKPHHRRVVAGFSTVFVWGDPDEAGAGFTRKVTASARNAVGVRLTRDDGDVSETFVKHGRERLAELIEEVSYGE